MALKIVNQHLFTDLNLEEDNLWLHRYFSSDHLKKVFDKKKVFLRFSRFDTYKDTLEGWDLRKKDKKWIIDNVANYVNYVNEDGGIILDINHLIPIFAGNLDNWLDDLKELTQNYKLRTKSYSVCWFADDNVNSESRYMWELYANKKIVISTSKDLFAESTGNGVMLSVKWTDIKNKLNQSDKNFTAGLISYGIDDRCENDLFVKDESYSHEKEFRIVFETEDSSNEFITLEFEELPCLLTIWKNGNSEIVKNISEYGFEVKEHANNKSIRTWKYSKLLPEMPQVDWSKLLEELKI